MKQVSKVLTGILIALSFSMAQASPGAALELSDSNMKQMFYDYVDKLEKTGVKQIKGKSLTYVKEEARKVQVVIVNLLSSTNTIEGPSSRESACWLASTNTLLISKRHFAHLDRFNAALILAHEFFRSARIYDEDYNVSFLTNAKIHLAEVKEKNANFQVPPQVNSVLIKLIEARENVQLASKGGVSGVGGGGDLDALIYKDLIFVELFFDYRGSRVSDRVFEKALKILSSLKIEISGAIADGQYIDAGNGKILVPQINDFNNGSASDKENMDKLIRSFKEAVLILAGHSK